MKWLALVFGMFGTAAAAQDWSLVGRHGECAPIASLQRKLPDLPDVRTPQALLAHLDRKKLAYTTRTVTVAQGQWLEVQVPAAELAVVLAPQALCDRLSRSAR